jgi:CRISPR-associated DxTHG motif protein
MTGPHREHVLLTALGINPQPATYVRDNKTIEAKLAPAALLELLPESERPHRILALCTKEAEKETLPLLREVVEPHCPVEAVGISADVTDEAVQACLTRMAESVPADVDLTVDVTHGLRHTPFLIYVGVLYLTALRGVRLRGAYYGMLRGTTWSRPAGEAAGEQPPTSAFLDLRPLVELPSWFHALRVLADTGSASVMADVVAASAGTDAGQVGAALRALSEAYGWGLPVEHGYLARRFLTEHVESLREVLRAERLPLADGLVDDLVDILREQQLRQDVSGEGWKRQAILDRAELERQAHLIDGYLARRDHQNAIGLMREWLALWAMWRMGIHADWLDYRKRQSAEKRLHEIRRRADRNEPLHPLQAKVGRTWDSLTRLRNHYAHHGLDRREDQSVGPDLDELIATWRETWRRVPELSLDLPPLPKRRILVSPVGTLPGVLYSALRAANPQQVMRCLVICSADTEGPAQEACRAAGYTGQLIFMRLDDPFAGTAEFHQLIKKAKPHLIEASEVYVNVTGGTTLMGVLADRIARVARKHDRPTYPFLLVDRRSPSEQKADPYQEGDVCWLDEAPEER